MLNFVSTGPGGPPQDIDDLIYGDTGTVPSERICRYRQTVKV